MTKSHRKRCYTKEECGSIDLRTKTIKDLKRGDDTENLEELDDVINYIKNPKIRIRNQENGE